MDLDTIAATINGTQAAANTLTQASPQFSALDQIAATINGTAMSGRTIGPSNLAPIGITPPVAPAGPAGEMDQSPWARRWLADPSLALAKGVVGLPQSIVGLADIPTFGLVGKAAEALGVDFPTTQNYFDSLLSPEQQEDQRAVDEATGFLGTVKAAAQNPSVIAQSTIESLPSMLGGAAIARKLLLLYPTLSPLIAAAIGEGAISAGQTAETAREEGETGLLTPKQAGISAASGVATGLLNLMGGKLAKRLGIDDVDTLLATLQKKGAKAVGREIAEEEIEKRYNILFRVIAGAIQEGAFEELPQSLQEQVAANLNAGRPAGQGVAEAGAMGMLIGSVMGSGANAFGPTSQGGIGERHTIDELKVNGLSEEQATAVLAAPTADEQATLFRQFLDQNKTTEEGIAPEQVPQAQEGQPAPAAPEVTPEPQPEPTQPQDLQEQQAASDAHAERMNRPGKIKAVQAPDDIKSRAAEAAAEILGGKVVFVENETGLPFDGTRDEQGNIFVDVKAQKPYIQVVLHEALEGTAREMPAEFKTLSQLVLDTANSDAMQAKKAKIQAAMDELGENNEQELTIQILQEFGTDQTFWDELMVRTEGTPEQRSLVRKAIQKIIELIDGIVAQLKGVDPNTALAGYFEGANLSEVRNQLADLLTRTPEGAQIEPETPISPEPTPTPTTEPDLKAQPEETTPQEPEPTPEPVPAPEKQEPPPEAQKPAEPSPTLEKPPEVAPSTGEPTTQATEGEPVGKFKDWNSTSTAKQIQKMKMAELREYARNAQLPSGATLRDTLGKNPKKADLLEAALQHRKDYLKSEGKTEKKETISGQEKIARMKEAEEENQYRQQQEGELTAEVQAGTMTREQAAKEEGVSDEFKTQIKEIGTSKDTPRSVAGMDMWKDEDGNYYAKGANGETVPMLKKSKAVKEFAKREKGKAPSEDIPFMAREDPAHTNIDRERMNELGLTTDLREAGYIRPDGKLIDLSGKKEGGTPGYRALDHREAGGTAGMQEFMAEGNIRIDGASGSIDIITPPTAVQLTVLEDLIERAGPEAVYIDIGEGLGEEHEGLTFYNEPKRAAVIEPSPRSTPRRIVNQIKTFFDPAFMAQEDELYDEIQAEMLEQIRKGKVQQEPGAERETVTPAKMTVLKHLKTVTASELESSEPIKAKIQDAIRSDPQASRARVPMQKIIDFGLNWIDEQGSVGDAYNALESEEFNSLEGWQQVAVLQTVAKTMTTIGYQQNKPEYLDAALQAHIRAGQAARSGGLLVKAMDMWRVNAPTTAAEAMIFAKAQIQKITEFTLEKKGRQNLVSIVTGEQQAASSAVIEDLTKELQSEKAGRIQDRIRRVDAEESRDMLLKGWRDRRRSFFKNVPKMDLPAEYITQIDNESADLLTEMEGFGKGTPTDVEFMAKEDAKPTYEEQTKIVAYIERQYIKGADQGKSDSDIQREVIAALEKVIPQYASSYGDMIDLAGVGAVTLMESIKKKPRRPSVKQKGPATDRDTQEWVQETLDNTSATLDELIGELEGMREDAKAEERAKRKKKLVEKLEAFAEENGITEAEAQAILFQRAIERGRDNLFEWADSKADPEKVQRKIEQNSLLAWGRQNGMPAADLKTALSKPDPLGELGKWAKANGIAIPEEVPFLGDRYRDLRTAQTAESLLPSEREATRNLPEDQQRMRAIRAQGRLAYELRNLPQYQTKEGTKKSLQSILTSIIRQPYDYNRTIVEQLKERIIDAGFPEQDAEMLSQEISDKYAVMIKREMTNRLTERFLKEGVRRGAEDKKALENIIMATRTGMLSDAQMMEAFSKAYGMKTFGEKELAEVDRLGKVIEDAAERTHDTESDFVKEAQDDLNQYLYSMLPHDWIDLLMTFRKQAMLSGITTPQVNIVSTAFKTANEIETTIIQELLKGRLKNVPILLRGLIEPIKSGQAMNDFIRIVKEKIQVWKPGAKFDAGMRGDPTQSSPIFNIGGYWNPLHWAQHVFSWMQAQDHPFFLMNQGAKAALVTANELRQNKGLTEVQLRREVARKMGWGTEIQQFMDQAKKEGWTGRKMIHRAFELRTNSLSDEARLEGTAAGNVGTYNVAKVPGILGVGARLIQQMKSSDDPLVRFIGEVVFPFVSIPFNVGNTVIANSPLGFIRVWRKNDYIDPITGENVNMDPAKAKTPAERAKIRDMKMRWSIQATQGSIMMLAGMFYFMKNWKEWDEDPEKEDLPPVRITAFGPTGGDRAAWYAAGNEPYSISLYGKNMSYRAWTPLLAYLTPMGSMMDMLLYGGSDDPTKQKNFAYRVGMNSLLSMPQAVIDQTSLMAFSDILEILESTNTNNKNAGIEQMNNLVAKTLTSFVPNLFKQVENIFDPSVYSNETIGAAFLQNIPFAASPLLNKRLNMFGEEIKQSRLRQFSAAPVPHKAFDVDPVAAWILANDIPFGMPHPTKVEKDPRTNRYIERSLTDEERYRFMKIWGPMARKQLERRIPAYKGRRKELIERDMRKWRRKVLKRAWYQFNEAELTL